jgi:hypothetical protein
MMVRDSICYRKKRAPKCWIKQRLPDYVVPVWAEQQCHGIFDASER